MQAKGTVTKASTEVTGWLLEPVATCDTITKMKAEWPVPIEGLWIPPKTTVLECLAEGVNTKLKMSAAAENGAGAGAAVELTVGHKLLGWYEPMARISEKIPGTLVKK